MTPDRRPLVLLGFMGSGKTTVGRRAAQLAGADFCDLDDVIERDAAASIPEIFERDGEGGFRRREAALLREVLGDSAGAPRATLVAVGGGTPMDGESWQAIRTAAFTVWLDAPLPELLRRADRGSRPMLAGRTEAEIHALYQTRIGRYRQAERRVDSTRPVEEVAREVIRLWDG